MSCLSRLKRYDYLITHCDKYFKVGLTLKCVQRLGGIYRIQYDNNLINNYLNKGTIVADIECYSNLHGMILEMPIQGRLIEYNYNYNSSTNLEIDWLLKIDSNEVNTENLYYNL
jgi:glycine cleavage system H lipoate-binding protein